MEIKLKNHKLIQDLTFPNSFSKYQRFDLYLPKTISTSHQHLIIYLHGGVWRSGDKANNYSIGLIQNLSNSLPEFTLSSINYRLSIEDGNQVKVKYPNHDLDVIQSIEHLISLPELNQIQKIYLIGHSIGAFISLSISGLLKPNLIQSPQLSTSVKISGLILIDGIYDLVQLIDEYPKYNDFILNAFDEPLNDRLDYLNNVSPSSWSKSSKKYEELPKVLIIHSREDTLLSLRQSEIISNSLQTKLELKDKLQIDFDSISGDHDELLLSPQLALRIKLFVK